MKQSNAPAKGNTRSWKETFHNAKVQQTLTICAFLAIPMILLVMFTYLPLADMIRYSLYRWDGYSDMKFIGLDNYSSCKALSMRIVMVTDLSSLGVTINFSIYPTSPGRTSPPLRKPPVAVHGKSDYRQESPARCRPDFQQCGSL